MTMCEAVYKDKKNLLLSTRPTDQQIWIELQADVVEPSLSFRYAEILLCVFQVSCWNRSRDARSRFGRVDSCRQISNSKFNSNIKPKPRKAQNLKIFRILLHCVFIQSCMSIWIRVHRTQTSIQIDFDMPSNVLLYCHIRLSPTNSCMWPRQSCWPSYQILGSWLSLQFVLRELN